VTVVPADDRDDLRATLRQLADVEEIRQLVAQYATALCSRDVATLAELFVSDVDIATVFGGKAPPGSAGTGTDALRTLLAGRIGRNKTTILHVTTHEVTVTAPDHAQGVAFTLAEMGDEHIWIRQSLAYTDTYEREAGAWRFRQRCHELFYGVADAVSPLNQPPACWPMSNVGVGTLPASWATWRDYQAQYRRGSNG
jgi:uncharacterized protein (TIGR02246 family)